MQFIRFRLLTPIEADDVPCKAVRVAHKSTFRDDEVQWPAIGEEFPIWQTHPERMPGYEGLAVLFDGDDQWRIAQA